jgi:hypothetical protein
LAAFSDGTLPDEARAHIGAHVASCDRCLDQVGALVRLDREAIPEVPGALLDRATTPAVAPRPHIAGWRTGLAVAATLGLSLGGWFYAQRGAEVPSPAPADTNDQVRGQVGTVTPTIVHPAADQRVARGALDVAWQPTVNAIAYRLRVTRDDGTVVWEGETPATTIRIAESAGLPARTPLYVSVAALMPDGRTTRSSSVRFEMAAQ